MATVTYPFQYRGTVVADTRPAGKLTIQVPGATGTKQIAASAVPVLVGFDDSTHDLLWYRYGIPAGTPVWVQFEGGNPAKPVVMSLL
jgi:hypothetical protein